MHTLLVDGRKYIGITCQDPKVRWNYGNGYRKNTYFWRAIKKYGWNAFKHEILFEDLSEGQACVKEQALIKLFQAQDPEKGFNLTSGGEHFIHSKDSINTMSRIKTKWADFDQKIIQLYTGENKTQKEIAKILDAPVKAIDYRIHKLGLKKTKDQIKQVTGRKKKE